MIEKTLENFQEKIYSNTNALVPLLKGEMRRNLMYLFISGCVFTSSFFVLKKPSEQILFQLLSLGIASYSSLKYASKKLDLQNTAIASALIETKKSIHNMTPRDKQIIFSTHNGHKTNKIIDYGILPITGLSILGAYFGEKLTANTALASGTLILNCVYTYSFYVHKNSHNIIRACLPKEIIVPKLSNKSIKQKE